MNAIARTPLTAYQRDVWAANANFPENPQFNCQIYDSFQGSADLGLLADCLHRAAEASDAFRLRFGEVEGTPHQWLADVPEVRTVDLSAEPDPAAACRRWIRDSFDRPFDLRGGRTSELTLLVESGSVVHAHVKAHHIVADAWGLNLFMTRVRADYEHVLRTGAPLTAEAPQYVDFVRTEGDYRASREHEADRDFFRASMAGVVPEFFPRKEASGARRSARHSFVVERALVNRIRERGESVFAFVSAAFSVYLSRVLRTEEIVLGVPLLNRPTDEQRRTVGHFANTLPLLARPSGDKTMGELVAEIRGATRALKPHERLALGDVLRDVSLHSSDGPRRLFDVTIAHLRWPRQLELPGLSYGTVVQARAHDTDALAVVVNELDDVGDLLVDVDYGCDVFDEDFPVEAVGRHLKALIERTLDDPDLPLAGISMLAADERAALVDGCNKTAVEYAADRTLHGLFEEQVARTPDRTAVVDDATGESFTFAALDERANRIARVLRERGVRPGDRVAVLMDRCLAMPAAVLGVLKSGGAYTPVAPDYPAERIRFLIEDSGAKAVLVAGGGEAHGPAGGGVPVLDVEELPQASGAPLEPAAGPRDPAYVIYTSGSTGKPKGVVVEHRSVINRLAWMQSRYPVGEGDVLLQKTPISFDVSVWELFWWAVEGASLALLPPGGEKDPREILRTIARRRVGVVHFVPSMFAGFLDLLEDAPGLVDDARSLHHVFCSGEALPPALVDRFNRVFAGRAAPRLVNLYGPTEATVDVSFFDCPADPARPVGRVPIGRPIDNIRLYVLDEDGGPQPVGAPGELCIAGVGVARGYLNRPELTREKFADDPFVPGGRMYRTGDLVRRLADGDIEYLGRIDGQVKIRGNRVELGEVQDRLATCPGVRTAAVTDHRSADRGTYLVGYYTADEELDAAVLRGHLAAALPGYMIPAHFQRLDELPLTPNGKTDRRRLPAPELSATGDEAPRDEVEAALAAIWSEVLGVERVGVHQNYYALGGDSILMLRIRALAEKQGIRFALADLVLNPTVAGLAGRVRTSAAPADAAEPAPFALVPTVDRARLTGLADAYPATRLQLGLLYHSREHENSAVYHDVFHYSLRLPWDEQALRTAFARLTVRHPVLRSGFSLAGFSEPLQTVRPQVDGGLEVVDLREAGAGEAEAVIGAHIEERRHHAYDFDNPPLYLFRAHALRDSVELVLSFHHAILDGWSVATLVRELLQDYLHETGQDVEPVADGPLPSAAHYVLDERRALASEAGRAFWRHKLAGAEPVQFDGFRPYEAPGSEGVFAHRVELPDGLGEALRRFTRERSVPIKSVLFAAHCLLLRLFGGTDDVVTGLVMHGRPELAGAERVTGLFLGTTPIRIGPGHRSWLDVVREAHLQEQEAHPHRHYPLSAVQEDLGGDTVIESAFNYVNPRVLSELLQNTGVELTDFRTYEETNFKLLVNAVVDPADKRIWLRMDHDGRVFTRSQADRFGRVYLDLLRRIVERPDEPVGFGFLAPAVAPAPRTELPALVTDRFDERVAATPDAIAVAFEDQRWTYRRLGEAADRVARRLVRLGAGAGSHIGLAMDRSPEVVAALLGIAKAGAACVPMDVTYPPDRLALMVDRADPFRVLAPERHAALFPGARVLPLDEALAADDGPEPVALPTVTGETTAYILFTSGSTGEPKGVVLPHRTLANYMEWQIPAASGAAGGKTLQFAPLSFDVSFQEIFSTLCGGGTLQLVREDERRDMPALLRLLDREAVERVFLPYVALQQLAEASEALGIRPAALRVIISSGEQLRVTDEIRRFCAAVPGTVLENQYGPTETHLLTSFTMSGDPAEFPALPPIGRPLDGIDLYVLDADMRPVPPGAKGIIHIGGVCLAHGYLGRPDLTDERFVPHPFGEPGERLYRTGDLARLLPGGDLVWLGREDSQVKVRGFRVELAEVELALTKLADEYPGVREVAVVARHRDGADAFLAAFLVGEVGAAPVEDLRARLRGLLPDYMVPSHFEWLPALPLTPSGKRDDARLRRTALASRVSADRVAPRDAQERALAGVLAELLQVPEVGVHDDFFALGGTSLTAMRLVVTIEKLFGVNVPLSALIGTPTVAGLAERLREREAGVAYDPVVPIRTTGSRPPMFLVHPLGGNVLCYLGLAKHLPEDQPVYALQAAGTHPGVEPSDSIPEIAARYLEAVRRARPDGPYVIGGWSFGGFIAFEMARQLRRTHPEDVASLILIDPIAVAPGDRPSIADGSLLEWFFWELLWMERGGQTPLEAIPEGLDADGKFGFVVERATAAGILPAEGSQSAVRRLFAMFKAHWHALLTYRPERADEDLVLLRADAPLPKVLEPMHGAASSLHEDPSNGWREMTTGRVEVVDVPGDHLVLLEEPHVAVVAEHVARAAERPFREGTSGEGSR
ncbi:amino acid adenylation domain-containing protein [Streptomyces sp. NBC_00250]|uniref:non-ribosomal peptide synthetase n=1 Tax=Streptomyces sp. NBC_00250 TaxID=2903641 RepID=UPI002E2C7D22|nr:non-ribosomal peptide synthetase [Streptomyces sp. NBC_00250]